jgi:hypothetical protein
LKPPHAAMRGGIGTAVADTCSPHECGNVRDPAPLRQANDVGCASLSRHTGRHRRTVKATRMTQPDIQTCEA